MTEEFKVAESVVMPVIPVVDYRQQIVNALDLVGMESMVDDLCAQWVEAYQEERDARRELAYLDIQLGDLVDKVGKEKFVEIKQVVDALGRSTKEERAKAGSSVIVADKRVAALTESIRETKSLLENAKATLAVVTERRKDTHMKYRGRETIIDFFKTVARVPFAPDEDGIVKSLDGVVEKEAGPDQIQAIQEAVAGGMSAAEAVRRSFDQEEIQVDLEDTLEQVLPKDREEFRVSL